MLPTTYYNVAKNRLANHKWFCNTCNNTSIETLLNKENNSTTLRIENGHEVTNKALPDKKAIRYLKENPT